MNFPVRISIPKVMIDHHILFIHGDTPYDTSSSGDLPEEVAALRAGAGAGIASDRGVIAVVVPVQTQVAAPVRVELWQSAPQIDELGRDFVADIDFDVCADRM